MIEILIAIVLVLIVIAVATVIGPKIGVASPLLLVAVGLVVSMIPSLPTLHIEPDFVLEGLLPPLLFASAVAMPTMSFRREFGPISGLAIILVIVNSLILGLVFIWLFPELGFAWGVALGAIISPTDAAAVSLIKKAGVPSRVLVLLEGESMLNDATALVLLRTAIVRVQWAHSHSGQPSAPLSTP